jgi:hypothetical protein
MKQPKRIILAGLGAALFACVLGMPRESSGQAAANEQQQLATLVAEIAQQQAKIVENQKQLDEKLAAVSENLRLTKIYVSRGGGPNPK